VGELQEQNIINIEGATVFGFLRGNQLQDMYSESITDHGIQSLHHKDKQHGGQGIALTKTNVFSRLTIDKDPCGGGG
jgi:hypothetical protein